MVAKATDIKGPNIQGKGLLTHKQNAVDSMAKPRVAKVEPSLLHGNVKKY
jgi:hypothetical protein